MLQVPNLMTTKRLPGIVCIHENMRVRITANILAPWAVQDSTGVVLRTQLHPVDVRRIQVNGADTPAEFHLLYPPALYVQLDGVKQRFLPGGPCAEHVASGADPQCPCCIARPGVIMLKPQEVTWYFNHKDLGRKACPIRRVQLPIMPLLACPLYGLQGTTADPGLVAHWNVPKRMSPDVHWLLVYVILSRVRALKSLVSFGFSDTLREVIERGPPDNFVGSFDRLFGEKVEATGRAARDARHELGWG